MTSDYSFLLPGSNLFNSLHQWRTASYTGHTHAVLVIIRDTLQTDNYLLINIKTLKMETISKQDGKNKYNLKTIAGLAFGLIIAILVQQYFFKPPSFDKQMMQVASELNKTCPIMVDAETQFDNAVALPEKTFQYNYTLINIYKDSIDIEKLEEYLKPVILNTIKTNPDLKSFRDNNVVISYNYKDKDRAHVLKLTFTPDQYK